VRDAQTGTHRSLTIQKKPQGFRGSKTMFLALLEEHKLNVSGSCMLRRIFGAKKRLHNEDLKNIYKFLTLTEEVRTYLHIIRNNISQELIFVYYRTG
jgi:hypothetical protein